MGTRQPETRTLGEIVTRTITAIVSLTVLLAGTVSAFTPASAAPRYVYDPSPDGAAHAAAAHITEQVELRIRVHEAHRAHGTGDYDDRSQLARADSRRGDRALAPNTARAAAGSGDDVLRHYTNAGLRSRVDDVVRHFDDFGAPPVYGSRDWFDR